MSTHSIDGVAKDLLEAWQINCRLNPFMIAAISAEAWADKAAKGKAVGAHFTHIHNVRLMWIKSAAPDLHAALTKLEGDEDQKTVLASLKASDAAMDTLILRGLETGKIKGFKPHTAGFVGYCISHETYHRAQAELALRLCGHALDDRTSYGLWEWGVR